MTGINFKNLDLNLLIMFEAIYSAGNISHAANHLAMSQPAVSNALARLRDLIDDQLFVRAKRGVEPTSKAKQMIGPVREALALIKRQLDDGGRIDLATYHRRFRILMIDTLEPILVPPMLKIIIEKAPGISIESVSGYRVDFVNEILTGTLDLAFYIFPVNAPDIVTVPICPIDVVVIARRGHPGIGKTLDLETLRSLKQVTLIPEMRALTHVDKDMVAHEVPRNVVYMVNRLWSMPPIVERSDLIGLLPRHFVDEVARNFDIVSYEPPVKISEQYLYMLWHAKNEHDPGHKWLREQMLLAAKAIFPPSLALADPPQSDQANQPAKLASQADRRTSVRSPQSRPKNLCVASTGSGDSRLATVLRGAAVGRRERNDAPAPHAGLCGAHNREVLRTARAGARCGAEVVVRNRRGRTGVIHHRQRLPRRRIAWTLHEVAANSERARAPAARPLADAAVKLWLPPAGTVIGSLAPPFGVSVPPVFALFPVHSDGGPRRDDLQCNVRSVLGQSIVDDSDGRHHRKRWTFMVLPDLSCARN